MITLSEGSQTEKDKYHEIAIQGEKTHRNLFTKQTHRLENRLMVTKGKGRGGKGINWESGIDMYTPLCLNR